MFDAARLLDAAHAIGAALGLAGLRAWARIDALGATMARLRAWIVARVLTMRGVCV